MNNVHAIFTPDHPRATTGVLRKVGDINESLLDARLERLELLVECPIIPGAPSRNGRTRVTLIPRTDGLPRVRLNAPSKEAVMEQYASHLELTLRTLLVGAIRRSPDGDVDVQATDAVFNVGGGILHEAMDYAGIHRKPNS